MKHKFSNSVKNIIFSLKTIYGMSRLYVYIILFSAIFNSVYNVLVPLMIKVVSENIMFLEKELFQKNILLIFFISIIINLINAFANKLIIPKWMPN